MASDLGPVFDIASLMLGRRSLNIIRILATCALVAACTRGGSSASHGGQDGGGGNLGHSTSAQVVAAIDRAVARLSSPMFEWLEPFGKTVPLDRETNIIWQKVWAPYEEPGVKFQEPTEARPKLTASRILIKDSDPSGYRLAAPLVAAGSGPCQSNHGDTDASVSKNAQGADICFNVDRLRAISPQSLEKEVFCLLIHEMTHLAGFGEVEANKIQKLFADNYELVEGNDGAEFIERIHDLMFYIQANADTAVYHYNQGKMNKVAVDLGTVTGLINTLYREFQQNRPSKAHASSTFAHPEQMLEINGEYLHLIRALESLAPQVALIKSESKKEIEPVLRDVVAALNRGCHAIRDMIGSKFDMIQTNDPCSQGTEFGAPAEPDEDSDDFVLDLSKLKPKNKSLSPKAKARAR